MENPEKFERMSIDEFSRYEISNGEKYIKVNDIWWGQVRGFFYRTIFPFHVYDDHVVKPPTPAYLGGYQYSNQDAKCSNSYLNYIIFDDVCNYSIDKLSYNVRWSIKKASKVACIKRIDDLRELQEEGHNIYVSFYNRTGYAFNKKRIQKDYYDEWARNLFNNKKIVLLGAYINEKLVAMSTMALVEDVAVWMSSISHSDFLKHNITDLMLHAQREFISHFDNVKFMYAGMCGAEKSVDDFKLIRGGKIIKNPAYYYISPMAKIYLNTLGKSNMDRMKGEKLYA